MIWQHPQIGLAGRKADCNDADCGCFDISDRLFWCETGEGCYFVELWSELRAECGRDAPQAAWTRINYYMRLDESAKSICNGGTVCCLRVKSDTHGHK